MINDLNFSGVNLISLYNALSFNKTDQLKNTKTNGISNWATQLGNKKFCYFISFNYTFLSVGSTANNLKKDNLPTVAIVGMITVIINYSLIAIFAILHNSGVVEQIIKNTIDQRTNQHLVQSLSIIFSLFLFIAVVGVLNDFTNSYAHNINNAINLKIIINTTKIRNKMNLKRMMILIISLIYSAIWLIISICIWVLGGDNILDG
ncbi:hypothetical protein MBIO_0599 [Mycoplasmopsis fermentans PG18]|uniref:Uncharacterized protein n=1 Tax=Mycoplasmopsis fermentans (strain ATCC 19989 / NBRC 14854 / NCTC 10117 / PG18) TaxID=496833 RepID=C4XFE2_MYCFP|nr:hypothetical protein MBIO_0599 [Mycoplasmopsis fermentans PG18]VEU64153.1 Uncharacterised protein [Mycoplasmopsis fermentans]VEU67591.1 Uncharacterised protein [Mesomycoplasma conjunctivae]